MHQIGIPNSFLNFFFLHWLINEINSVNRLTRQMIMEDDPRFLFDFSKPGFRTIKGQNENNVVKSKIMPGSRIILQLPFVEIPD